MKDFYQISRNLYRKHKEAGFSGLFCAIAKRANVNWALIPYNVRIKTKVCMFRKIFCDSEIMKDLHFLDFHNDKNML